MPDRLVTKTGVITSQRPAWPVLNSTSTLANGLVSMFAAPNTQDLITGVTYSGTYDEVGVPGIGGSGFRLNAVDQGLRRPATRNVMILRPLTIACHVVFLGTPTVNANIFGVSFNAAQTTPFVGYSIGIDASGNFCGSWNNGGGTLVQTIATATPPIPGVLYSLIHVNLIGAQAIYVNGRQVNTGSSAFAGPTYGVGPVIAAGELSVQTRNPNLIFLDGMIWNRFLTATERQMLDTVSPWDLYAPPKTYLFLSDGPQPDTPPSQYPRPRYVRLNTFSPQAQGLIGWFPTVEGAFVQVLTPGSRKDSGSAAAGPSNLINQEIQRQTFVAGGASTTVAPDAPQRAPSDFGMVPRSYKDVPVMPTPQSLVGEIFQPTFDVSGLTNFTIVYWIYPLPSQTSEAAYFSTNGVNDTTVLTNSSVNMGGVTVPLTRDPHIRGRWQMITVSRAAGKSLTLWRDQEIQLESLPYGGSALGPITGPPWFQIGGYVASDGVTLTDAVNALWADFRIYNRAWNQNDVNYAYNPATRWDYYADVSLKPWELPLTPPASAFLSRLALMGAG